MEEWKLSPTTKFIWKFPPPRHFSECPSMSTANAFGSHIACHSPGNLQAMLSKIVHGGPFSRKG